MKFQADRDDDEVLDYMKRETKRDNKYEVIRDALSLYQFLIEQIKNGNKIYIGQNNKMAGELKVKQLENAR